MVKAFAFNEPQPVILEGTDGLPVVGLYPAGAGYLIVASWFEDGASWLTVELPSADGPFQSEFPEWVGSAVDESDGPMPEVIGYREAAVRFPDFITSEELEDYDYATQQVAEWNEERLLSRGIFGPLPSQP